MQIDLGKASTGETVRIDLATLVTTRMLVTASSGGGKSETLRRILEESVGHIQCIVLDPEGEFSTLRERYPFVLVGEGGETPADIRTAALVATRLLELNASAVCDLYEMRVHDRHEWVKRFLDALVHAPKSLWHPVLVIIDEAHTYCPERGYGESVASQSIIDLANLGRKRGFCAILATQRLSKLNKNAVEPLQNYLVGRTTFDDQARAASTFKIPPGKETREFSLLLERLGAGEFICRGRAVTGDMLKVQVKRGITRPPATGTAMAGVVTPTPEAIKALLPKLADLPQEVEKKERTEADLRQELVQARRRIVELERMESIAATGMLAAKDTRINELERFVSLYKERFEAAMLHVPAIEAVARILTDVPRVDDVVTPSVHAETVPVIHPVRYTPMKRPVSKLFDMPQSDVNLRAGARRMLAALCQWMPAGRTEAQLATQVQMKRTGGTWAAYKSDLKQAGFIEIRDGMWYATEAGRAFLGADIPQTPTTTQEVVELWGSKLRRGAREMLDALVRSRGKWVDRQTLGTMVGMESSGGTFAAYLSDLKQAGLIVVGKDGVAANREALFL